MNRPAARNGSFLSGLVRRPYRLDGPLNHPFRPR